MKTGKLKKIILVALFPAILFIACEKHEDSGSDNYAIDSVFADGSTDAGTTTLTITVNDDKLVLTADDIKINAYFPVIKGGIKKTGTAKTYELLITPGEKGVIRVGLDPYRGFTGWDAKTTVVYAEWFFSGTTELTITGCSLPALPFDKIPSVIAGLPVTAIGNKAFYERELVKVIIEDIEVNGIKVIGNGAFANNQLTEIVIPDSVTVIKSEAFSHNNLEDVRLSKNITEINSYSFAYNQLTKILIPDNVTTIGGDAFADNMLTEITIPDGVKTIDIHAFINNPLKSITIGEDVTLGSYSFGNGFEKAYNINEKKKGTYTFTGDKWTYSAIP